MAKNDARKLTPAELEATRSRAVLLKHHGHKVNAISEQLGVSRSTISRWLKTYDIYGNIVLPTAERGRKHGAKAVLTDDRLRQLLYALLTKSPKDYQLKQGLWTRQLIEKLIDTQWQLSVRPDYVPRILRRSRFPSQKPPHFNFIAPYQNVLTGEQTTLGLLLQTRTTPAPKIELVLQTPVATKLLQSLEAIGPGISTDSYTLLSSQVPTGQIRFRCFPGTPTSTIYGTFLTMIGADHPKIVIYNHPFIPTSTTRKWLEKNAPRVTCLTAATSP